MSLNKIISGGQTGADQAALDTAIKHGIAHGGWISKGRPTEHGRLDDKYHLQEIPKRSYPKQTRQNVINSDGTLIFTFGKLTSGSKVTRNLADKHNRPCLHIDLEDLSILDAGRLIKDWINKHNIQILNVAGSRISKAPGIYKAVSDTMQAFLLLDSVSSEKNQEPGSFPGNIEQAVEKLVSRLSLKDKTLIANMEKQELLNLDFSIGTYIRNEFGIWEGNNDLIKSCEQVYDWDGIYKEDVVNIIVFELWKKLRETYILKVI